jgi:hypothetical protein
MCITLLTEVECVYSIDFDERKSLIFTVFLFRSVSRVSDRELIIERATTEMLGDCNTRGNKRD